MLLTTITLEVVVITSTEYQSTLWPPAETLRRCFLKVHKFINGTVETGMPCVCENLVQCECRSASEEAENLRKPHQNSLSFSLTETRNLTNLKQGNPEL
jgi:hypothetical protein